MQIVLYKLDKNLWGRAAAQLNWNLEKIKSSIFLVNEEGRMINGKSLIGLLSGNFKENSYIRIMIEGKEDVNNIREYFNEVGREVEFNG